MTKTLAFRILMKGAGSTGKTSFANMITTGDMNKYAGFPIRTFKTTHGTIEVLLIEHDRIEFDPERYDAILHFHKVTDFQPYESHVPLVHVFCFKDYLSDSDFDQVHEKKGHYSHPIADISNLSKYNHEKPILFLLRQLLGDDLNYV